LNGDEWQHETPRSIADQIEVTDAVQNVNILLQNDEVMRAEGERERKKKGESNVEELEEISRKSSRRGTSTEVENEAVKLIELSVEELDQIATPLKAEEGMKPERGLQMIRIGLTNSLKIQDKLSFFRTK
jgi:uncharacterized small protein (DUF1192 family)